MTPLKIERDAVFELPATQSDVVELVRMLIDGKLVDSDNAGGAPATCGAYAILVRLDVRVTFQRKRGPHVFAPGWYVYVGSAYGQGDFARESAAI